MGFVRGEPIRSAPVKVLVPPFAMVCWGSDEWVLRADSAPSLATPVGPLPRSVEASKAAVCYVRNTSTPAIRLTPRRKLTRIELLIVFVQVTARNASGW
jgi:hypothetical protein